MNCPNCGAGLEADALRCRKCGSAVTPPPASCPAGQAPVNVIIQMAPGQIVPGIAGVPQPVGMPTRSRVTAGVLGIVLGWLGVHRFYLGYTTIGLVQLLVTLLTCGYGAIVTVPWGVVEGVMILIGHISQDGQGRLLKD